MSNTQSHLIVKEEGICIYRVPDGSDFTENFQDGSGTGKYDEKGYQEAVKQAQSSAILCEDQERASDLLEPFLHPIRIRLAKEKQVSESYIASYGLDKKEAIGKSYPVPGIEFEPVDIKVNDCDDDCAENCDLCYHTETVARLIEHTAEKESATGFTGKVVGDMVWDKEKNDFKIVKSESPEIDKEEESQEDLIFKYKMKANSMIEVRRSNDDSNFNYIHMEKVHDLIEEICNDFTRKP